MDSLVDKDYSYTNVFLIEHFFYLSSLSNDETPKSLKKTKVGDVSFYKFEIYH